MTGLAIYYKKIGGIFDQMGRNAVGCGRGAAAERIVQGFIVVVVVRCAAAFTDPLAAFVSDCSCHRSFVGRAQRSDLTGGKI